MNRREFIRIGLGGLATIAVGGPSLGNAAYGREISAAAEMSEENVREFSLNAEVAEIAELAIVVECRWHPIVAARRVFDIRIRHSDDSVRRTIQRDALTQNSTVCAEVQRPEPVRKYDDTLVPELFFSFCKASPQRHG